MSFWLNLYRAYRVADIIERRNNKSISKDKQKIKKYEEQKQLRKQQIKNQQEYERINGLYSSLEELDKRIWTLHRKLDCYQYPNSYQDERYPISKINPFALEAEFKDLISRANTINLEDRSIVNYLRLINMKDRIEEIVKEAEIEKPYLKEEAKKATFKTSNPKFYNQYANFIIGKKNFNGKERQNLIKKIGASGLDTESRVRLIEMLNNKH